MQKEEERERGVREKVKGECRVIEETRPRDGVGSGKAGSGVN
jgi:hypothetical protein